MLPLLPRLRHALLSGPWQAGLAWQRAASVKVTNEPVLAFTPGSPERTALQQALKDLKNKTEAIPCVIGDEEVWTSDVHYQVSPFNHGHKVAKYCYADKALLNKAIEAALAARKEWDLRPISDRAQIFLKAADILSGPRRAEILAKTMVGQGKTVIQAEIDAAAELIDFFRFNAKFAMELEGEELISVPPSTNRVVYRGLEGFVAAVSPFNFTAIGGNLAGAPALMGNVVMWKPSDTAMLASYAVYKVLREAGLPPNIIQFVPADGPVFGDTVTSSEHFCGLNFTGSVPTFKHLWKQVANNLDRYHTFPRLAGECGGKNFHFVHSSADVASVVSGTLRSAFEYGGQKCSACSRLYVPDSLWPKIKDKLLEEHSRIRVGDPVEDFGTFFSAVIDAKSFGRIKKWLEHARSSPNLSILAGGQCDDSVGYFVQPCIVESKDPKDPIMKEEIFGPILTVYVYPEGQYKKTLQLVDSTSPYGLTGAVFAQDKNVIREATEMLRNAAGNFYINDKSTGSVVAQQPFGGSRASGTNDKPGGPHYILRWTSPQVIKETHAPLGDWKYSYMQ
ncbi:delta-1-pyrroline-5-carboxylate dehydrogenase, mitochondrial [Antechinus flavipes]|uniref:delta-1-pyrroline-5-carboxylate dehydrogenase, mitochondrial n=1 Tax=Antechinus flavipes TaxID=38775 RepID=UPI00223644DA|nr:delta-1-pyrroline-5-carboxylate dehydrogenase, mitochondrial [Antechinus flavipes]